MQESRISWIIDVLFRIRGFHRYFAHHVVNENPASKEGPVVLEYRCIESFDHDFSVNKDELLTLG